MRPLESTKSALKTLILSRKGFRNVSVPLQGGAVLDGAYVSPTGEFMLSFGEYVYPLNRAASFLEEEDFEKILETLKEK